MKKNKYTNNWIKLILLFCIGIIISYYFAFSKTIELFKQKKENRNYISELINLMKNIKDLEKTIEINENKKYINIGLDSLSSRQKLLDLFAIASEKYSFSIKEVTPIFNSSLDSVNYDLSVFTIEGNFFELLKTWNFIENKIHFGYIPSARFFILEDYRINKKKLNLTLYVELFKNKSR